MWWRTASGSDRQSMRRCSYCGAVIHLRSWSSLWFMESRWHYCLQSLLCFIVFSIVTVIGMLKIVHFNFISEIQIAQQKKNRQLKDVLHRCDRAMIYIFIAGSYFPWLSLSTAIQSNMLLFCLKWTVWLLAAFGILYQQVRQKKKN